jgi:hypothetical protein
MLWTALAYLVLAIAILLVTVHAVLPFFYRRGRQVEFRIGRGSGTGRVLGMSGFKLRVRSLHSGTEHTVGLTRVRRR